MLPNLSIAITPPSPPLILTKENVDVTLEIFDAAIAASI